MSNQSLNENQGSTTTLQDVSKINGGFKPSIKISVEKNSIIPKNFVLEPRSAAMIPFSLQQPSLNLQTSQSSVERRKNQSMALLKLKKPKTKEAHVNDYNSNEHHP
jgi:hypothetical protein